MITCPTTYYLVYYNTIFLSWRYRRLKWPNRKLFLLYELYLTTLYKIKFVLIFTNSSNKVLKLLYLRHKSFTSTVRAVSLFCTKTNHYLNVTKLIFFYLSLNMLLKIHDYFWCNLIYVEYMIISHFVVTVYWHLKISNTIITK